MVPLTCTEDALADTGPVCRRRNRGQSPSGASSGSQGQRAELVTLGLPASLTSPHFLSLGQPASHLRVQESLVWKPVSLECSKRRRGRTHPEACSTQPGRLPQWSAAHHSSTGVCLMFQGPGWGGNHSTFSRPLGRLLGIGAHSIQRAPEKLVFRPPVSPHPQTEPLPPPPNRACPGCPRSRQGPRKGLPLVRGR